MNKLLIFIEALDKSNEMCYTIFVNENRLYAESEVNYGYRAEQENFG